MDLRHIALLGALTINTPFALAAVSAGKTANGCSYSVINGKYIYSCDKTKAAPKPASNAAVSTSYNSVPMNGSPKLYNPQPTVVSDLRPIPVVEAKAEESNSISNSLGKNLALGLHYSGTSIAADSLSDDNAEGVGFSVAADIDDFIGVNLTYSYSDMDTFLGLEERSNGAILLPQNRFDTFGISDSELTNHLIAVESQFFLTSQNSNFRPFAGLGLALKMSKLSENLPKGTIGKTNSSVSQNSLGTVASLGTKLRLKKFQIVGAFRFFLPVSTSEADWKSNFSRNSASSSSSSVNANDAAFSAPNLFRQNDTELTDSSVQEFMLGVGYFF